MSAITVDVLAQTLKGLEAGFHVRHIASFDLAWCNAEDSLDAIVGNPLFDDFDHIPVRRNFDIVGVLETTQLPDAGRAEDAMRPIDPSMIVSGEESLSSLVRRITDQPYWLVATGSAINGIVTRSDVHKLPVRLLTFAVVTHLEMTMATLIRQTFTSDAEWLILLSPGRQKKIQEKLDSQQADRLNPPLLELTDLCDKRQILKKSLGLSSIFEKDLATIEKLRNSVAHAGSYAADADGLARFVRRFTQAENWIKELESMQHSAAPSEATR